MDIYEIKNSHFPVLEKRICNNCGKTIDIKNHEEHIHVYKYWAFNSNKDGIRQKFDLCEKCVDSIVSNFKYPPDIS